MLTHNYGPVLNSDSLGCYGTERNPFSGLVRTEGSERWATDS
jgi:hypothetical protein